MSMSPLVGAIPVVPNVFVANGRPVTCSSQAIVGLTSALLILLVAICPLGSLNILPPSFSIILLSFNYLLDAHSKLLCVLISN